MAIIINELFTGTDGTQINGFNSWIANSTGLQIQANQAAKTDNGSTYAYKSASGWTGARSAVGKFSRYEVSGTRFINRYVMGSTSIASAGDFIDNSIHAYWQKSDNSSSNTGFSISDGLTLVASNFSPGWQLDGAELTITFTMAADGSGTCVFAQNANSTTLTWGARTWTNGTGNNHGFYFDWSGSDGTSTITRSQCNSVLLETATSNFIPTILSS